jgi:hypothetical protein
MPAGPSSRKSKRDAALATNHSAVYSGDPHRFHGLDRDPRGDLPRAARWCAEKSKENRGFFGRKIFYIMTCEFCFSHYVTMAFLILTRYKLLYSGWLGYLIAGFSLVWVANIYMSIFGRPRLEIKRERVEIDEVLHEGQQSSPKKEKVD